jgi:hypothetical protein
MIFMMRGIYKRGGRGNVRVKFTGLISMITLSYLAETR